MLNVDWGSIRSGSVVREDEHSFRRYLDDGTRPVSWIGVTAKRAADLVGDLHSITNAEKCSSSSCAFSGNSNSGLVSTSNHETLKEICLNNSEVL